MHTFHNTKLKVTANKQHYNFLRVVMRKMTFLFEEFWVVAMSLRLHAHTLLPKILFITPGSLLTRLLNFGIAIAGVYLWNLLLFSRCSVSSQVGSTKFKKM